MSDKKINNNIIEYIISDESKGLRADQAIALENAEFSRSLIKKWINQGNILRNGNIIRPKDILYANDKITIISEENINPDYIIPEKIKIKIIYEDNDLIIIDKENDIVSHPAPGNNCGTLANGLAYIYPELQNLPRSGLIHRLDKNTTGLLIVARNIESYTKLVKKMQERNIDKYYIAYTHGLILKNNCIKYPISRHKIDRKKMSVNMNGKEAITDYEVIRNYKNYSKLKIKLLTGRTHQIRVHMQYEGFPIIGDKIYGEGKKNKNNLCNFIKNFPRQALHAEKLEFDHPITKEKIKMKSSLPDDLVNLEKYLENE